MRAQCVPKTAKQPPPPPKETISLSREASQPPNQFDCAINKDSVDHTGYQSPTRPQGVHVAALRRAGFCCQGPKCMHVCARNRAFEPYVSGNLLHARWLIGSGISVCSFRQTKNFDGLPSCSHNSQLLVSVGVRDFKFSKASQR